MKRWVFRGLLIGLAMALLVAPCMSIAAEHGGGGGHEAKPKSGESKGKAKKTDAATITGGMFEGDPVFVNFPPFTLPIINKQGAQQIVSLIVNVQVKDRAAAEAIQKTMPKLRDLLFEGLYIGMSDGSLMSGHALDLPAIKDVIVQTINAHYKEKYALDILIQAMSQRKL